MSARMASKRRAEWQPDNSNISARHLCGDGRMDRGATVFLSPLVLARLPFPVDYHGLPIATKVPALLALASTTSFYFRGAQVPKDHQ